MRKFYCGEKKDSFAGVARKVVQGLFIGLTLLLGLSSCDNYSAPHRGFTALEQIKREGVINVLTRHHATTYTGSAGSGKSGLEYDLIMMFAKRLGVSVKFIVPDDFGTILDKISENKANLAAAGITVTEARRERMRFSDSYQSIKEQVVYRSGNRPKTIAAVASGILEVASGTSHIDSLNRLKETHPDLSWSVNEELDTDALMFLVNEGLIDYTVADSHQASALKQFYPKLYTGISISKASELAWAMPLSDDDSLYNEVNFFFAEIKKDKVLKQLLDKYYGDTKNLGYVNNCTFRKHVEKRLPRFKKLFQEQAEKYDLDWRLLAAIGYQESHWLVDAVSPTGVKGIMMLTNDTAKLVGVKDRTDPVQSIAGGAKYFRQRIKAIPARITEPDRTWFALASYNVGFGHLLDARVLAVRRRRNPDKWLNIKAILPLLSQKKWYKQTKYGYARGNEPVRYVENIRGYYKLLIWLTEEDQVKKDVMSIGEEAAPAVPDKKLLEFDGQAL